MASQHIIDINLNDNLQDVIRKANYNFKVTNASALRNTKNSVRNVTVDVDQEINAINNAIEVVSDGLADETTARQNADTALDNQIDAKVASAVSSAISTAIANAMLAAFPVGCIYITATNTNPGTFLGGTWQAVAPGRVLVGAGTGTDANHTVKTFTIGSTGGEYTHTLTQEQMPRHSHYMAGNDNGNISNDASNSNTAYLASWSTTPYTDLPYSLRGTATVASKWSTGANGSNNAFNVMQPYLTVYFWKRIS